MNPFHYDDLWPLIQQDILGLLQADPLLGARPGVLIEPGDTVSQFEERMARVIGAGQDGKNGLGYLVLPIEKATDKNPSVPFGPLKLLIQVKFVENVKINRGPVGTGRPIRVHAARAAKILKLYWPVGLSKSLVPGDPVLTEFTETGDLRAGLVEFTGEEDDSTPMTRLGRPVISVAGTRYPYTITVTLPPGAATVYYTLDGSHPWPGNPAAVLYGPPVTVTQPALFRARAFAAGGEDFNTVASDTNAQLFS